MLVKLKILTGNNGKVKLQVKELLKKLNKIMNHLSLKIMILLDVQTKLIINIVKI